MYERIASEANLLSAWQEFRRGKRNKRDTQGFEFRLEENLFSLRDDLLSGEYRHGVYESFYVRDPKLRHIHKASVRDRLLHQAVFRVVYPIFDKRFIYDSYSSRLGKGTHAGVARLAAFLRKVSENHTRGAWALKCDIRKFFDSVDHKILIGLVRLKIADERTIRLIEIIVESFQASAGKGLPLGNVTSQLFGNIYMNELDRFVKHALRERHYLRYSDDFLIVGSDLEHLKRLITPIADFLRRQLSLSLHPTKVTIRKVRQGVDFLGYVSLPHHVVLRTKTKRRMFERANLKNLFSYLGLL